MDDKIIKMCKLYLLKADECLKAAEFNFTGNQLSACINRSYYCVFHCMNACIVIHGFEFSKHSVVIAKFRELFMKYKLLPVQLSDIIDGLFKYRNNYDYDVEIIPDDVTAEYCLKSARYFYDEVKKYLDINVFIINETE